MAKRVGADPKKMIKQMRRLDKTFPSTAGQIAVNEFKENFRRQGWLDRTLEKWEKRVSKKDSGRAVLVLSGVLKRSIRVIRKAAGFVLTGTEVAYAAAHNEGAKIKGRFQVRTHSRKTPSGGVTTVASHVRDVDTELPRRQFIGESKTVIKKIERVLVLKLKRILG